MNTSVSNRKFRYRKDYDFTNLYRIEEYVKYGYWPGGYWRSVKLVSVPFADIPKWIEEFIITNEWKYYP